MARITRPLTDTEIKQAKPKAKEYTLADGQGLLLRIIPTGAKTWCFNYIQPDTRKRTKITLGAYPALTLAKARKARESAHALLADGIDPKAHREQQRLEQLRQNGDTLEATYIKWLDVWQEEKDPATIRKLKSRMERLALPQLGHLLITELTAPLVIDTLKPLEKEGKHETVLRVRTALNQIMTFAVNTGIAPHNPLAKIGAAFKTKRAVNQPALPPSRLPELMRAIEAANIKFHTRQLILWNLHTLVRPKEAAGTRWDEINIEEKLWRIPAERMKGKQREHIVPLSPEAFAILDRMRELTGNSQFVFPNERDFHRPASSESANRALIRMGYQGQQTSHGFRSIGSTAMNEHGFMPDAIEAVLAHVEKNDVRRAYNRSIYLEQRVEMMAWWSDFIIRTQGYES